VIHLLHGKDAVRVHAALDAIRASLPNDDKMLESNTTSLDGRELTPDELLAHATAVPFLSPSRLVIVRGLLRALGEVKRGRAKKKSAADDPLEPWWRAAAQLADPAAMPETTTLVFVEGELAKNNAAFTIFAPIAQTVEFAQLSKDAAEDWLRKTASKDKVKLDADVAKLLVELVGADLWALTNELDKLAAYAGGDTIDEKTVRALVAAGHDTKFWEVADAVVAGNERKALTTLGRLLTDGIAPQVIMSMIARQYRQMLIVKEMRERRVSRDETARAAGVPPWKVDDIGALASRYSWPRMREAYGKLLDADLSVKRGLQDDESALQLLVHELCAMRPPAQPRPAYAR
jgi:DNA polymerase-3 subunit delta